MLEHGAGRLARRLSTLFMLAAVLAALVSAPVEPKAIAATPSRLAAASATARYCQYIIDDSGRCAIQCCNGFGCSEPSC